jgi:hypothetical protein
MMTVLKRALPDWLLIIVASKLAATSVLLGFGFG